MNTSDPAHGAGRRDSMNWQPIPRTESKEDDGDSPWVINERPRRQLEMNLAIASRGGRWEYGDGEIGGTFSSRPLAVSYIGRRWTEALTQRAI